MNDKGWFSGTDDRGEGFHKGPLKKENLRYEREYDRRMQQENTEILYVYLIYLNPEGGKKKAKLGDTT